MGNAPSSSPVEEDRIRKECVLVVLENATCEICIEPVLSPNDLFNNGGKCTHPICTKCMIKYIQAKLEDNIASIRCPDLQCNEFLDPLNCRGLVGPELFVRWSDVLCESALVGVVKCYCPYWKCSALIVNECGGIVKKVVCPSCRRPFCFKCKIPWHCGVTCSNIANMEFGRGAQDLDWNDRACYELAKRMQWKRCPQCNNVVELTGGCRIVECRCRASFCYICGKQVRYHWCSCETTPQLRHVLLVALLVLVVEIAVVVFILVHLKTLIFVIVLENHIS